jgi:hypothetical protein
MVEVEYIIVDKSAMAAPTASMGSRQVLAKIDCELIDPIVSMGSGRFAKVSGLYSMPRPTKQEDGSWCSTELIPLPPTAGPSNIDTVEYCYQQEPNLFGYNPIKSIATSYWIFIFLSQGRSSHAFGSLLLLSGRGTRSANDCVRWIPK